MKNYAANNIRNFALVGHGSSGKTMLSESMLYKSGEINRLGSIEGHADQVRLAEKAPADQRSFGMRHKAPLLNLVSTASVWIRRVESN